MWKKPDIFSEVSSTINRQLQIGILDIISPMHVAQGTAGNVLTIWSKNQSWWIRWPLLMDTLSFILFRFGVGLVYNRVKFKQAIKLLEWLEFWIEMIHLFVFSFVFVIHFHVMQWWPGTAIQRVKEKPNSSVSWEQVGMFISKKKVQGRLWLW